MPSAFLSYARDDDEPFVERLRDDLVARGIDVWWDRLRMESRGRSFHQELLTAIDECERLVLVVSPKAAESPYVRQEWEHAIQAEKVVTPILRLGDYSLIPSELRLLHSEDFREGVADYDRALANLVRQLSTPPPPLGKLIAVPSLPPRYLERQDRLVELRDALRADLDRPVTIAGAAARIGLSGMGGIGKSVLAAAVARDRKIREAFPDGVFWIGLGPTPDIRARLEDVFRALGGTGDVADEREGKEKVRSLLRERAALLVIDDAWRRSDVEAFDVLGSRCRALITTRDAGLLTALGGTHHYVELLTDGEALHLLAATTGVDPEQLPVEAAKIVAECGRLPLAIALCGGLIRAGRTWKETLERLENARVGDIATRHALEPQHRSVRHAIHASVEFLRSDPSLAERNVAERFLELAVFPNDDPTPAEAIAVLWAGAGGLDETASIDVLSSLAELSLLRLDATSSTDVDASRRTATLHDLVHDYLRSEASDLPGLHERLLSAYAGTCDGDWKRAPNDGYFYERFVQHVLRSPARDAAQEIVRSGFLDRKAELLGDGAALADARTVAEAGAASEAMPWDDLLACAYAYCGLAERIRAAPEAIERFAERGDVERILQAVDAEPQEFERGAILLAAAMLLREHGHVEAANDFDVRADLALKSAGQSSSNSENRSSTLIACVDAAVRRRRSPPSSRPIDCEDAAPRWETLVSSESPRSHIPTVSILALYATHSWEGWFWSTGLVVGGFLAAVFLPMLLYSQLGYGRDDPFWLKASVLVPAYTASFGLLAVVATAIVTAADAFRESSPWGDKAMQDLLAGARAESGRRRSGVLLRALRLHELIGPPESRPIRGWSVALASAAIQEFDDRLTPEEAASWIACTAGLDVRDGLLRRAERVPQDWLRPVCRSLVRRCSGTERYDKALPQAVALTQILDDPSSLSDFARGTRFRDRFVNASAALRPAFLARTILAALKRGNLGTPPDFAGVWRRLDEAPLGPIQRLWALPVTTLAVGGLAILTAIVVWFVAVITVFLGPLFTGPVSEREPPPSDPGELPDYRRMTLFYLGREEGGTIWDHVTRSFLTNVVLGQMILRGETVDFYRYPRQKIEGVLRQLSRSRSRIGRRAIALRAMNDRKLLDVAADLREGNLQAAAASMPLDPSEDLVDLLRIAPLRPVERSFSLSTLFAAISADLVLLPTLLRPETPLPETIVWLAAAAMGCGAANVARYSPRERRRYDALSYVNDDDFLAMAGGAAGGAAASAIAWIVVRPLDVWINPEVAAAAKTPFPFIESAWCAIVIPFLIVNLGIPWSGYRWRGAGMLYPTTWRLALRRFGAVAIAAIIVAVLAAATYWIL